MSATTFRREKSDPSSGDRRDILRDIQRSTDEYRAHNGTIGNLYQRQAFCRLDL